MKYQIGQIISVRHGDGHMVPATITQAKPGKIIWYELDIPGSPVPLFLCEKALDKVTIDKLDICTYVSF